MSDFEHGGATIVDAAPRLNSEALAGLHEVQGIDVALLDRPGDEIALNPTPISDQAVMRPGTSQEWLGVIGTQNDGGTYALVRYGQELPKGRGLRGKKDAGVEQGYLLTRFREGVDERAVPVGVIDENGLIGGHSNQDPEGAFMVRKDQDGGIVFQNRSESGSAIIFKEGSDKFPDPGMVSLRGIKNAPGKDRRAPVESPLAYLKSWSVPSDQVARAVKRQHRRQGR